MDKGVIVREWIDYATKDINSAKYLLGMRPIPLENYMLSLRTGGRKNSEMFSDSSRRRTAPNA
jgi:hypothetical protein